MKSSSFHSGAWQIIVCRNKVLQPDSRRENLTIGQLLKKRRIAEIGKCVLLFFFKHHSKVWIWGIDGTTVLKEEHQRSVLVGRRRAGAQRFH